MRASTYRMFQLNTVEGTATYTLPSQKRIIISIGDLERIRHGSLNATGGYVQYKYKEVVDGEVVTVKTTLHRYLTQCPKDMVVDHINHNTLDNRQCNLRICTKSENRRNNRGKSNRISNYKGVVFDNGYWRAYTTVMGKRIWFGTYKTEAEAGIAYNENAIALFGEFACLNTVPEATATALVKYVPYNDVLCLLSKLDSAIIPRVQNKVSV